jgi:hypothetical protein
MTVASVSAVVASSGSSVPDTAAWWSEATRAFGESRAFSATRTRLRFEEVDESGAVQSYESGETVTEWVGTESKVTVVRAEKNGKDATEDWRKRYSKSRRASSGSGDGGPPEGFDATPFDPKYAKDVVLGEALQRNGLVEVPYTIKTGGGPVEGVAYFSPAGKALSASQQWTEPPMFVSAMKSTLKYAYQDGILVIGGMKIEGQASILVIKKRFRMSFEFDDWERTPRQ